MSDEPGDHTTYTASEIRKTYAEHPFAGVEFAYESDYQALKKERDEARAQVASAKDILEFYMDKGPFDESRHCQTQQSRFWTSAHDWLEALKRLSPQPSPQRTTEKP